jgi:UDP-N-acetyl-D-glucosamine dehydrogenase
MLRNFLARVANREATVGVVGLGYVGLPLAITFARAGFKVVGFDIDPGKPVCIQDGKCYLEHIKPEAWMDLVNEGRLSATTDFSRCREVDAILVCVPTPLNESREPDLSFVESSAHSVAPYLRQGTLFALESSTYPGTTDELVQPILESGSKLQAGRDFFLVFSPEREDPGNPHFGTKNIPKVVGGLTKDCLEAGCALYGAAVEQVVPVQSTRTAEMVKLFENIYRAVNIALVNETKMVCHRLNIDVWEVIKAASTKPFGFQAFWPGPGLGGHCIPIDPFYLTWKARQVDMSTRFIELAGEINTNMPYYVVDRVRNALNTRRKSVNGSSILVLGAAYKRDIGDMRESPALKIIELLTELGARVLYHDPHVPFLPRTRKYAFELKSADLTQDVLRATDCVLVVTDHKNVDYDLVARTADLVVDSRNIVPKDRGNVVEA